jgi:hypothetical protein
MSTLDRPRPHEPSSATGMPPRRSLLATPPTSSVSRVVTHLARHTPPTALVPLPSTPQQRSHRQAMAARAIAQASAAVTVPVAPARAARVHYGPPRRPGQAARWAATAGRQPTPHPNTVVLDRNPGPVPDFIFFFSFQFSKISSKCLESLKIIQIRV